MTTPEEVILIGASRLRNYLHRGVEAHLREYGLTTSQFSVLQALYAKGPLNVGQIERAILGTPGNVPLIINNLIKAGYATRRKDDNDRRVSVIELTEKGLTLISSIYPEPHQEWLIESLSEISDEEKKDLSRSLLKCMRKLKISENY